MSRWKKAGAVVAALVFAAACAIWASNSASASRGPNQATPSISASPLSAQTMGARRYSCPTGDGTVNWGDGKVCTDAEGARFHIRDSLTDGDCVQVLYWSDDIGGWRTTGPKACTTGQWITFTDCCGKLCDPNARLSRGPGEASFPMPNNYC
jgi:hypothetical protein